MKINVEFIEHEVVGQRVIFALDQDNDDWYFETVRKKPFKNPVHHHIPKLKLAKDGVPIKYADFGANIGTTSFFAAAMGIPVLAIEAGSANFVLLLEAQRENGFGELFRPVYIAAADEPSVVSFNENSAWGAISGEANQTSRVPTATIAQILQMNGFGDVDVIKIDIEGAELRALNGLEAIVKNGHPDLIVESNEIACFRFGYKPQELWQRMIDLGYDVYMIDGPALTQVTNTCAQAAIVKDVLATTRSAESLANDLGYKIEQYDAGKVKKTLDMLIESNPDDNKNKAFYARQIEVLD